MAVETGVREWVKRQKKINGGMIEVSVVRTVVWLKLNSHLSTIWSLKLRTSKLVRNGLFRMFRLDRRPRGRRATGNLA